jgi:hypothetical protein
MNKYAKLLAIVFFVSSVSPVFATEGNASTTASTSTAADAAKKSEECKPASTDKGCLSKTKDCAWTVIYASPFEGKYTWEEANDYKGKLKFLGKHFVRLGGRAVAVLGTVAGVTALVKYLKGDKAADEFADEEEATEENVA